MPDVFVSYSRTDQAFVRELAGRLTERGKDVWVDWEDIPPTADWLARIKAGIEESSAFVFVISPDSAASVVCGQEVAHATAVGKRIVPVLLRPVDPAAVPGTVSAHNWISFTHDSEAAHATLLEAIETDLPWLEEHTRWLGRAREWEEHDRDTSFLLRGSELGAAEAWIGQARAGERDPPPTALQYEHVGASRHAATRRARTLTAAVSVALVVAIGLAVVALIQRSQAIDERERATARALLANAALNLDRDPELSVALAARAVRLRPGDEGEQALRRALALSFVRATIAVPGRPDQAWLTPDGRRLLTADVSGGVARLFDVRTGRELRRFGGMGTYGGAALSPDGRRVMTVGGETDPRVHVWDAGSGRELATLRAGPPGIVSAAWSPDGERIVTSASDGVARVWEVPAGRLVAALGGGGAALVNAVFAASGDRVATGDGSGRLTVWDVARRRAVLRRAVGVPAEVHVTPDGSRLVALGEGGTATVFALAGGARLGVLRDVPAVASSVALSPDGRYAVTAGGSRGTAALWRLSDGKRVAVLGEAQGGAAVSPDGALAATGAPDGSVRLWSLPDGRAVGALRGHHQGTGSVAFAARADRLVSLDGAGAARVWQPGPATAGGAGHALRVPGARVTFAAAAADRRVLLGADDGSATVLDARGRVASRAEGLTRQVFDGGFAAGGARYVAGGADVARLADSRSGRALVEIDRDGFLKEAGTDPRGRLLVVRWEDGAVTSRLAGEPVRQLASGADDAAVAPDGGRVAVVGGGEMGILSARTGAVVVRAPLRGAGTMGVTWGPRGLLLVTRNGRGFLVDERLRVVRALPGGTDAVIPGDGAFSADGVLVALGIPPGARVWRSADGREVARIDEQGGFGEPQFSPDGRFLLTGTDAATAQVWDLGSGVALAAARGDVPRWIPGTTDFTTVDDGAARVWSCEPCRTGAALLRLADERVTRELTTDERQRYFDDR